MIKLRLFLPLLFSQTLAAQMLPDTIEWSNKRLTWSNFKGRSDTAVINRSYHATTLWKLRYQYKPLKASGQLYFIIVPWFDARSSWVRPAYRTSSRLLQHEQGHFDLAEIFARRFRRQLHQTTFSVQTYADSIHAIFSRLLAQAYATQQQYDRETIHGENTRRQVLWQASIAATLKELAPFSKQDIRATLQP